MESIERVNMQNKERKTDHQQAHDHHDERYKPDDRCDVTRDAHDGKSQVRGLFRVLTTESAPNSVAANESSRANGDTTDRASGVADLPRYIGSAERGSLDGPTAHPSFTQRKQRRDAGDTGLSGRRAGTSLPRHKEALHNDAVMLVRRRTVMGTHDGASARTAGASMSPGVLRLQVEEARHDLILVVEKRIKQNDHAAPKIKGKRSYGFGNGQDVEVVAYAPCIPIVPRLPGGGYIGQKDTRGGTAGSADMSSTGSLALNSNDTPL